MGYYDNDSLFSSIVCSAVKHTPQGDINKVEEVPQNMYCISSAAENIIMDVPQKIPISAFSAKLAYNGIYIINF